MSLILVGILKAAETAALCAIKAFATYRERGEVRIGDQFVASRLSIGV